MSMNDMKDLILLDTHVWIWLLNGDENRIHAKSLSFIEHAAQSSNVKISAISVWELGMLESKGRVQIPMNCLDWVNRALNAPGISLAEITPEIAIESSRLPGKFHSDPADRLIVASARNLDATLITHDKSIISYSKEGYLRVLET